MHVAEGSEREGYVKAWGEDEPSPRHAATRGTGLNIGDDFVRTDLRVLMPWMALSGANPVEALVLIDPRTGNRFGEVPASQSVHPMPLADYRLLRSSPAAVVALEEVATTMRELRRALGDRHAARHARWIEPEVRRVASQCARPVEGELAFDAQDAGFGSDPEPASWWPTAEGARLHVPDRWAGEWQGSRTWWMTDRDLLVAADPDSERLLTALARHTRARTIASAARTERVARRIGERCLGDLAPQFEGQWLPETIEGR
jgi:hypothetical protein